MRIYVRNHTALLTLLLLWVTASATHADTTNKFTATLTGELTTTLNGKSGQSVTDTTYVYRRIRDENRVDLILDGMKLVSSTPVGNQKLVMTRERFYSGERDKYIDISRAKADASLKERLEDTYGSPLVRSTFDENGRETNTVILARPGAKRALEGGVISGIAQFHPPFFANSGSWTNATEIPIGNGGTVRGILTYRKTKTPETSSASSSLSVVSVSGVLKNPSFQPTSGLLHKHLLYKVNGTQTYDLIQHEWIAANLTMAISLDLFENGKKTGDSTGTLHAVQQKVPLSYEMDVK